MTRKQKRIVAALALANVLIILALAVLVTRISGDREPHRPRSGEAPFPGPGTLPSAEPRTGPQGAGQASAGSDSGGTTRAGEAWQATQLLAQAGLGGTVTLNSEGTLYVEIASPYVPGQTADEVAQLAWVVFDVALALSTSSGQALDTGDGRDSFNQVAVSITSPADRGGSPAPWRIHASVSMVDLQAFSTGELSEDEFVERVTYTVDTR
jgi:hypothetical protein